MAGYKLHIMTNYPAKYQNYWTNNLTGVALTKYNNTENAYTYAEVQ